MVASNDPTSSKDEAWRVQAQQLEKQGWPLGVVERFLSWQNRAKGPVVQVQGVCKSFAGKLVLDGLSLDVREGEVVGIVGASGSGKTILLEIMAGLQAPDKGSVRVRDPRAGDLRQVGRDACVKSLIGFSPQAASLYPELSVMENLEACGALLDLPQSRVSKRIEWLSGMLNLNPVLDQQVSFLPPGLQKKADVACALLHEPLVVLLDEPVQGVDPAGRRQVSEVVMAAAGKGAAVILSSHSMEDVAGMCTRMGVLRKGSLARMIKPKDMESMQYVIRLVTESKRYTPFVERLGAAGISAAVEGDSLVVQALDVEMVMRFLLDSTHALKERILDVQVSRPGLEEAFEGLMHP